MYNDLTDYQKKHDYLVCVDSDGCAMDTMDCKHIHCFGPCMVAEWQLQKWEKPILERWNEINLYSFTRGINRFKGLAMALTEIDAKYTPIDHLEDLKAWVNSGAAPSNDALMIAIEATHSPILEKALSWSKAVNIAITQLPEGIKQPFPGAKDGLKAASEFADVAIVSSANRDAVLEEWRKHQLLDHVDIMLSQDYGSKAHCIEEMLKFGYEKDHVLMVGDAPGDQDAAEQNAVFYYPILVRHEAESWAQLVKTALPHLKDGSYQDYEKEMIDAFRKNLGG